MKRDQNPDQFAIALEAAPTMPAQARATDPDTSHKAAASLEADDLTGLQKRVLDHLVAKAAHGATTLELSAALGIDRVTVSPRLAPMADNGLVVDSGQRREGPSGRKSIVWVAKAFA